MYDLCLSIYWLFELNVSLLPLFKCFIEQFNIV